MTDAADAPLDTRERSSTPEVSASVDESILACRDVSKTFGAVTAVDHVSIDVQQGEWVSIVGPNGAGKTTLLNLINGFYHPDGDGRIFFQGEDITDLPSHRRARRGLGRTFQGVELFEEETVRENIMTVRGVKSRSNLLFSLFYFGPAQWTESENLARVEEIIDYLELWQHRDSPIAALPLGIRRRVDLGRALALEPEVLLLDESMSGLTFDEKYDLVRFLTDLREEQGKTLVMIEHDLEVVTDVSDRMIVLHNGQVIAQGPPEEVTDEPEVARVYTGVEER